MNDGVSHPERFSDGTEGVVSAEKGIISNIIKQLRRVTIKLLAIKAMTNEKDKTYKEKFMAFAIRMVKLKNYLNEQKHEYNIADQIQRSGIAIGANHREATFAESDSDFIHKLQIAQKECGETIYWLELLKATEYISEELFNSLYTDAEEITRMLTSSIMTTRKRLRK